MSWISIFFIARVIPLASLIGLFSQTINYVALFMTLQLIFRFLSILENNLINTNEYQLTKYSGDAAHEKNSFLYVNRDKFFLVSHRASNGVSRIFIVFPIIQYRIYFMVSLSCF